MEDADPGERKPKETEELLNVVIDELRNIGLILARQNERIEALSKVKDRAHPQDWDSVSVAVRLDYPELFSSSHILSGIRSSPFGKFNHVQFYRLIFQYYLYRVENRLHLAGGLNPIQSQCCPSMESVLWNAPDARGRTGNSRRSYS